MDKQPRMVEQLQVAHARQLKVIQQLQADHARGLSDLAEIRRERDLFRAEAARLRRECAELQNRIDEVMSEYRDLKRERATLVRSMSNASTYGRAPRLMAKTLTSLSVLTEGEGDSASASQDSIPPEKIVSPRSSPYPFRELSDPLRAESPRLDDQTSSLVRSRSNAGQPRTDSLYAVSTDGQGA